MFHERLHPAYSALQVINLDHFHHPCKTPSHSFMIEPLTHMLNIMGSRGSPWLCIGLIEASPPGCPLHNGRSPHALSCPWPLHWSLSIGSTKAAAVSSMALLAYRPTTELTIGTSIGRLWHGRLKLMALRHVHSDTHIIPSSPSLWIRACCP